MNKRLLSSLEQRLRNWKSRKRWQKVFSVMAMVVVFWTTYALILPAITMERAQTCTQEEHIHNESCYVEETVLDCGLVQSDGHQHSEECYTTGEPVLICELEEDEDHQHSDACYTLTDAFKPYAENVDWRSLTTYENWASLAETLKNVAVHDGLVPVSAKSGADGYARFSGLERGLYLVTGENFTVELEEYDISYRFTPGLITLPMQDAADPSKWIIDAEIQPKGSMDVILPEMLDELKVIKLWEDQDDLKSCHAHSRDFNRELAWHYNLYPISSSDMAYVIR